MIFRNFAFIALVVASSTLNNASADRTKLRGRWQVDDTKDASVDDAAVDVAGTPIDDAGLKRRRRRRRRQRRDLKKKEKKKGSASSDSTDVVGADNYAANQQKTNSIVSNNMAGYWAAQPLKDAQESNDAKDKKKGGGSGAKKKKNDKNKETGMYAGTFNYANVRPTAWNPSAVTLGSAQTNTNYASPGAATGNMIAGSNAVSSAGVYRVSQIRVAMYCGISMPCLIL